MTAVQVGLIGCGRIAQLVHLDLLAKLPGAQLVALAEADEQRLIEARSRVPTAFAVSDYRALLERSDVEAVVICLPTALHAEAATAALAAGKHVYLEKPLATNCDEGAAVLAAWQGTALVGMMGFNYRFNALYMLARRAVQVGKIGQVLAARSVFSSGGRQLATWKQQRRSGGGVLLDLASHHVDLIHYLFGQPVVETYAELRSARNEDDSAFVQLRLADGLVAQAFFSTSTVDEDRFEIYGTAGKISVDRQHGWNIVVTPSPDNAGRLRKIGRSALARVSSPYVRERITAPQAEPSYRAALAHFVAAVRKPGLHYPDFHIGYRSLAVVAAAERSAAQGAPVAIEEAIDAHLAD
ncbi:Gfo/Idh/MocA family oxidoreductase [Candidatus Gracilibacteria bacterium]|nr:Gfo/Idh/MocA family oxidoreductase [Candidatus Gracilibacteria bacterium]